MVRGRIGELIPSACGAGPQAPVEAVPEQEPVPVARLEELVGRHRQILETDGGEVGLDKIADFGFHPLRVGIE